MSGPRLVALTLLLLALLAAAPALAVDCGDKAGPGGADVACSCGDIVVTSTRLTLADPVVYTGVGDTECADTGLSIGADRVRLQCDDFELRGDGTGIGIFSVGDDGVRIQRCRVRAFLNGVRAADCSGFQMSDGRMIENVVNGLIMNNCSKSSVSGNVVEDNNGNGIELINSNDNSIKGNETRGNANGIDLQGGRGNKVSSNLSEGNDQDNLELGDSVDNAIKGNIFQGATVAGIHISSTSSNGNVFRKNTLSGNGSFDVHNGSNAGDNSFKGNSCATSLGPDVDCP